MPAPRLDVPAKVSGAAQFGIDVHLPGMLYAALRQYEEESHDSAIEVIGYRNIWFRFHPAEANIFVPVSLNMLTLQHSSFMNTYLSQRDASFPSYEMDAPFPLLMEPDVPSTCR